MKISILNKDFVQIEQKFVKIESESGLIGVTGSSTSAALFEVVSDGDLKGKNILAFKGNIHSFDVGSKNVLLVNRKDILAECEASKGERIINKDQVAEIKKETFKKKDIIK